MLLQALPFFPTKWHSETVTGEDGMEMCHHQNQKIMCIFGNSIISFLNLYFHRLICFASSFYSQDMFKGSLNMWLLQLIYTKRILGESYMKSLKKDTRNLWCWFLFGLLGIFLIWLGLFFLQRGVQKWKFKKYFKKKNTYIKKIYLLCLTAVSP